MKFPIEKLINTLELSLAEILKYSIWTTSTT